MGLTFLTITLGSTLIKTDNLEQVHTFISPIYFNFIHVFFLCCVVAIPGAVSWHMAGATMLVSLWRLTKLPKNLSVIQAQAKKDDGDVELSDWLIIVLLPTLVYLTLIVSGVGFLLGQSWAFDALAASCLVLLFSSVIGAWDMLIWIAARSR
jgi:hypothetical protein